MTNEKLEETISELFMFCNICYKTIDKNEPYIIAYKNGYPAYFCRDHIHNAKHYLDWFQEFVEAK